MRRSERAVTDLDEILSIINSCQVCRIALIDAHFPYIVPVCFGAHQEKKGKLEIVFHSAPEGKKIDLIRQNPHAAFEMDCNLNIVQGKSACATTMQYQSVCGNGVIRQLADDQKERALKEIVAHYGGTAERFPPGALSQVAVFALSVEQISCKQNR